MPRKYKVTVLPGDGIGPEVTSEAVRVLKSCEEAVQGLNLSFQTHEAGARYWQSNGKKAEWAPGALQACKESDAILLGAIGLPNVTYQDGRQVGGEVVFGLRMGLDLYANVRPVQLMEGVVSPLQSKTTKDIDLVIVRENTEDLYAGIQGSLDRGGEEETGIDVRIITQKGSDRIVRYAFNLAMKRRGAPSDGKKRVTCVDKSNVLRGCVLFRSAYNKMARSYPKVEKDYAYVDSMAQWLVRHPENYDVIVTTNLFGDILSELGASIQGGLGLAPSGNIGDDHAMFEPVHGSAPRHAGKNRANPIAAVLSGAMLLEWLGEKRNDRKLNVAASLVRKAVERVLSEKRILTYDLGGKASTRKMGESIAKYVIASQAS